MQHIIRKLFNASSLEDISAEELRKITEAYPSFGIGHYLFSKKLKQAGSDLAFLQQSKKTSLYFPNPLWLQWLLQQEDEAEIADIKPQAEEAAAEQPVNNIPDNINNHPSSENGGLNIAKEFSTGVEEPVVAPVEEEALVFEPYHTIDYFASQGIKLLQDEEPKDKFSKQLRSFTEWLKTMKKLPQKNIEPEIDETENKIIETEAAHSIESKEVVTEAMAEVLVKQGKAEEAAEIYRKLSLLNPDKSAYFAAKSEYLKVH